ncbi:hypothetical protein [Tsukamurella tyrosinosolvens]|uniref:hypothetical protein n=1 Tax=Tsukamurella tyrosinosolvens TaxID=57704 RepID=UPI0011C03606|nr:hypothetical protein [Tsukamurella tyrosinosolvens]
MVTKTVTATPTDQPNLDCQAPAVTLEVTWRRDVGEGMPPTLGPKDIVPHDYAEPFSLVAATVKITNLSPNAIHTRGVIFDAEWIDGQGTVKSTRYQYSGLVQGDTGYIPAAPRTGNRGAEQIDGGTSRELSREYRSTTPGDLRAWVRSGDSTKPGPYTWISDIDWWFTDKDVRDRCDRKLK